MRSKLTEVFGLCYDAYMDLHENPKIQEAIAIHLATGKYSSAEEVVLVALKQLAEDEMDYAATVADLRESVADENAGRMKPLAEVATNIRQKHGFSDPA